MNWLKNKKTVAVHSGNFHADDLFSVATISMYLQQDVKVIRTRNKEVIYTADYVLDVGQEYDPSRNRFDHHQEGGAGKRENGLPYATFGLVWKEFGQKICGSSDAAQIIDEKLVQTIDGEDNGIDIYKPSFDGVQPYSISDFLFINNPTWREENKKVDDCFEQALKIAKVILKREIERANDYLEGRKKIIEIYKNTEDKRIIVIDNDYSWARVLSSFPEPMFVIKNVPENNTWNVSCMKLPGEKFRSKIMFPEKWAGKSGQELVEITGVADAIFCHNGRFIVVSKSKEGAIELAKKALNS
jgi:uncharacterized UPF0160 family protein